jgi:hypothetical protein
MSARMARRTIFRNCLALGSLTIISSASATELIAAWEEREKFVRKPTPWNELGPFYKNEGTADNIVTRTWRSQNAAPCSQKLECA